MEIRAITGPLARFQPQAKRVRRRLWGGFGGRSRRRLGGAGRDPVERVVIRAPLLFQIVVDLQAEKETFANPEIACQPQVGRGVSFGPAEGPATGGLQSKS